MKSIKVCEYSRSMSFHDDLILQDQASGERSQDQWSSGFVFKRLDLRQFKNTVLFAHTTLFAHCNLPLNFVAFHPDFVLITHVFTLNVCTCSCLLNLLKGRRTKKNNKIKTKTNK